VKKLGSESPKLTAQRHYQEEKDIKSSSGKDTKPE
jgi:hypothetical protein